MKKILLLLLLISSVICNAQINNSVIGKWKLKSIVDDGKMDSVAMAQLKEMMKDFFLNLKANKRYKSNFLNNNEEGTWAYDPGSTKLVLTRNTGKGENFKLKLLANETAIFAIRGEDAMVLMRDSVTKEDEIEKPQIKQSLVSITEKQLCKKWYLKKRKIPGKSDEVVNKATELIKGTYLQFDTDKNYKVEILKIKETGKWILSNNNKTITTVVDNESKKWNIKSINETELVLYRGDTEEIWTYSTKLD